MQFFLRKKFASFLSQAQSVTIVISADHYEKENLTTRKDRF